MAGAPPPPSYGELKVRSIGRWADIYVNGNKLGRAPDTPKYKLPPGTYDLMAKQPGSTCEPYKRRFKIVAGKANKISFRLTCN